MEAIMKHRPCLRIGEHKEYACCRFCGHQQLEPCISFGNVPLAGGFLPSNDPKTLAKERLYPLTIVFCRHCGLLQVREVVESKTLFAEYFYRSSAIGTLAAHFQKYAQWLPTVFEKPEETFVVEIGSNDGVLLRPLRQMGFRVLGVDPAKNIVATVSQQDTPTVCACFGKKSAEGIVRTHGKADCIITSNSFAHIDDMHDVMEGVVALLDPQGVLMVETHYLGTLLREHQYDMLYHEHQSYYSLYALESFFAQYGMEVFDVHPFSIHGGSMHYDVQFKETGKRRQKASVKKLRAEEQSQGLHNVTTFRSFSDDIAAQKKALLKILAECQHQGKRVVGYGASGRATTMMSYCGINSSHIECVIDDAPAKQGAFTPGNHLPIRNSSILNGAHPPDYCLLFAWSFADEVLKRNPQYIAAGGKFIVPLPTVHIIP